MTKIEKRPFDIYLPRSGDKEAQFLQTVEVEVELKFGEEFLTPESSRKIEDIRARHMGLMTGEDIKSLRKRLHLSQADLTNMLQCGEKSLSRWENGHGYPIGAANTLLRLLDEGFLDPICLGAVQGPRSTIPASAQARVKRKSNKLVSQT